MINLIVWMEVLFQLRKKFKHFNCPCIQNRKVIMQACTLVLSGNGNCLDKRRSTSSFRALNTTYYQKEVSSICKNGWWDIDFVCLSLGCYTCYNLFMIQFLFMYVFVKTMHVIHEVISYRNIYNILKQKFREISLHPPCDISRPKLS